MISLQDALPLFVFLVVSFLAFYFVETIILLGLNHFIRRRWKFVIDTLLRVVAHHRNMLRIASFGVISLIIVLLFIFTSLADLLVAGVGPSILRFLALILVVTMLLIYYIGSKNLNEVIIAKRIHLFIFIILSLFAFTGIMSAARDGYEIYEEAINQAFVRPIVTDIEEQYEKRMVDRLLDIFREEVKEGGCEYYDYANEKGADITQFMLIREDKTLAEENPEIRAKGAALAGKKCVHKTQFLLTPDGKWYEVVEQGFN